MRKGGVNLSQNRNQENKMSNSLIKELGSAYIRYSSTMQDDSFSLEAQLRQIKARAVQDGVEIVKVYADPATSAYSQKHRPGIEAMLTDAKRGLFKYVYVHKLDRLARRLEWAIEIVKKLQSADVTLRSVEQKFDLDTPDGKLMFVLLGSLGEFYSDNLSQETGKGKHERAFQGYHNNQVPWGYKSELVGIKKQAVPDPNTQEIVKQMFERYATGLYYDQEIADWLTDLGHLTPRGKSFTKDTVREMLLNKFYLGLTNYNGRHGHKGKRQEKDRVWIKGVHPPLISEELFEKCLKVRTSRRRMMNSNQKTFRIYFLAGIITCSECKRRLRAQSANAGQYYREVSRLVGGRCVHSGRSVRSELVDSNISQIMENLVLPQNWQEELEKSLNRNKDSFDPQKERDRIKNDLRRMREAYKRGLYEGDEPTFWNEVERSQAKLSELEQVAPKEIHQAGQVLATIQTAWKAATTEEKRELCKVILKNVEFDFSSNKISRIVPHSEYRVLFQMIPDIQDKLGE